MMDNLLDPDPDPEFGDLNIDQLRLMGVPQRRVRPPP
jgi:hypothetical protein